MSDAWVVRLPTWLGDTVMALPTIRALSRSIDGPLSLWGPAKFRALLKSAGIDGGYLPYRRRRWADAAATVRQLRRARFDTALLLPNAFEPALLSVLGGVRRRIGYATDGRGWLLSDPVVPPPLHRAIHEADRFAGLLQYLGVEPPRPDDARIDTSGELEERGAHLLPERGYLGLVPGGANDPAKRWPPSRYAALADLAAAQCGAQPVLLGSADDRATAEAVRSTSESECIDLTGSELDDLAAALSRCRVVVSNDTGAAHLAAALGRPTVVLFGPTDPQRTAPRGPTVEIVTASVFCQPCLTGSCPWDHRCMEELPPGHVADTLDALWNGGRA